MHDVHGRLLPGGGGVPNVLPPCIHYSCVCGMWHSYIRIYHRAFNCDATPSKRTPPQELAAVYPNARNGCMAVETQPAAAGSGEAGVNDAPALRFEYKVADGAWRARRWWQAAWRARRW